MAASSAPRDHLHVLELLNRRLQKGAPTEQDVPEAMTPQGFNCQRHDTGLTKTSNKLTNATSSNKLANCNQGTNPSPISDSGHRTQSISKVEEQNLSTSAAVLQWCSGANWAHQFMRGQCLIKPINAMAMIVTVDCSKCLTWQCGNAEPLAIGQERVAVDLHPHDSCQWFTNPLKTSHASNKSAAKLKLARTHNQSFARLQGVQSQRILPDKRGGH